MASRYAQRSPVDELLHMAEHIEEISIRPLSAGIGLGATRPVFKMRNENSEFAANVSVPATPWNATHNLTTASEMMLPPADQIAMASSSAVPAQKVARKKIKIWRPKMQVAWQRLLLAHLADLIVVSMSLLVAFAVASVFFAPLKTMARPAAFLQWEPVKFVLELSAWQTVAALYGIFAMYWLVFRVVVGNTLGQNLSDSVLNSRRKQRT